jgi:RNA polymerase sigma-70 factor (ECF subfamily)
MDETQWLASRFEASRPRLRAAAYRMLGSLAEADDAVQEAWLHAARAAARSDGDEVSNLEGWLTTIVARVCLDMLRSRKSRREDPLDDRDAQIDGGPEQEALLADSVGLAMLVVLDNLAPAERVAFVLHDMFGMPFDDIASVTGRSTEAARQLASRGRRRVRGTEPPPNPDRARKQKVVEAFLAASRDGDFEALVSLLDPDVVLHVDETAGYPGAAVFVRGSANVAHGAMTFRRRAPLGRLVLINGEPAAILAPRGQLRLAITFTVTGDTITSMDVIGDRDRLDSLEITLP